MCRSSGLWQPSPCVTLNDDPPHNTISTCRVYASSYNILAAAKPELKQRQGAESDSSDVYYIYVCIKDPNKVSLFHFFTEIFRGRNNS